MGTRSRLKMAIQSLLNFVNGIGSTLYNGFTTFVTVNYYVGQAIFSILTAALVKLKALVVSIAIGTYIFLEDLSVFVLETCESILAGFELMTGAIDALLAGIGWTAATVKAGAASCVDNVCQLAGAVAGSVTDALLSVEQFFHLIGASLLLMVGIVPKTLNYVYSEVSNFFQATAAAISASVGHAVDVVHSAPVESFVGLVATALISFSTFKLSQRFVRQRNITWSSAVQVVLRLLCFIYLHFCLFLIGLGRGIARTVEFTLTHLHVPRFHHAGDVSDDEDDHGNDPNDNSEVRTAFQLFNSVEKLI